MKLSLCLRTANLALAVLLILVMGGQRLGFSVPFGKAGLPITAADVVLALAVIGVGLRLLSRKAPKFRLPPLQAFVPVAAACVSFARSDVRLDAAKEVLQLIEYFLVAFAVFLNVAETGDLKALLVAFAASTALIVLWAGWQYLTCSATLDVRAFFSNRNALGAFLALALPLLYGLALHLRCWGIRLLLLVLVAAGLAVNLSGGAVLVTLLVLGVLSALRGRRVLVLYLGAVGLILLAAPRLLPRPHQTDVLFSSLTPYVSDNFLLGDKALFARAEELSDGAFTVMAKNPDAAPPRTLFDAAHLMEFLAKRRGGDRRLGDEQRALYITLKGAVAQAAARFPDAANTSVLTHPRVAVRYQRWQGAITSIRNHWDGLPGALFGLGFVGYDAAIDPLRGEEKISYDTREVEAYNVATTESFTDNTWFKALVQTGLVGFLALAWFVAVFLGRALRLYGAARSELMLGVTLGTAGGILGFALVGIFTETVARGLTIPFVFLCVLVVLAERIVLGEGGPHLEELKPND